MVTVDDPAGLLRVSVRLVGIWDSIPDGDLPWAERMPPDDGAFIPLLAGDDVWVDFPYSGDSTRPRVVGRATDTLAAFLTQPQKPPGKVPYVPPAVEGAPAPVKLHQVKTM